VPKDKVIKSPTPSTPAAPATPDITVPVVIDTTNGGAEIQVGVQSGTTCIAGSLN
jgi:hypothetical protein